jgi:hypothetical protein
VRPSGGIAIASHGTVRALGIALDAEHVAAGQVITGRVIGSPEPVAVELARVESHPGAARMVVVTWALATGADGAFALPVASGALPTVDGVRCSLGYVVQARAHDLDVGAAVTVAAAPNRARVDPRAPRLGHALGDRSARHFDIELTDAEPRGSGRIAGRVHRQGSLRAATMTVELRCCERWRVPGRARGVIAWASTELWSRKRSLVFDENAVSTAFDFDPPAGLPPAVEGRKIAWRYEIRLTRTQPLFSELARFRIVLHEDAHPAAARR